MHNAAEPPENSASFNAMQIRSVSMRNEKSPPLPGEVIDDDDDNDNEPAHIAARNTLQHFTYNTAHHSITATCGKAKRRRHGLHGAHRSAK